MNSRCGSNIEPTAVSAVPSASQSVSGADIQEVRSLRVFVCGHSFHMPVAGMLSKSYARQRSQLIDPAKATCQVTAGQPPPMGNDTTYLCAVDSEGNMVSWVNSNFSEIEQEFKLRIVPFTATFRFLPLGRKGAVQPYIGGGVGVFCTMSRTSSTRGRQRRFRFLQRLHDRNDECRQVA